MIAHSAVILCTLFSVLALATSKNITMIEKASSPGEIYNRTAPVIIFEHNNCIASSCKSHYAKFKKVVRRIFNTHPAHVDRFIDFIVYENPKFKSPNLSDYFNIPNELLAGKSSSEWLKSRKVKSDYTAKLVVQIERAQFRIIYFYKAAKLVYQGVRNSYVELLRWVRKFTRQNHMMRMNEVDLQSLVKNHAIFSIVREPDAKYFGIFDLVAQALSPLKEKLLFSNLILMDASMKFNGYNCFHGCYMSTRKSNPVEFPIKTTEFSTKSLKFWILHQYFGDFPLFDFDFAYTMLDLDEPFILWVSENDANNSDDVSLAALKTNYPKVIIARGYLRSVLQLMPELEKVISVNHYHVVKGIGDRFVYLFGDEIDTVRPIETDL